MEEAPRNASVTESSEKIERVKKASEELVDDVLQANLLLPQVYSAINLHGASAFMRAAMDGVEPNAIEEYLFSHRSEFGERVSEYAERAHNARGVSSGRFPEKTEERNEYMFGLLVGHVASGRQCLVQYFNELENYSGYDEEADSQPLFDFLEGLKNVLRLTDLREDIRIYNTGVAASKLNKNREWKAFRKKWFQASKDVGVFDILKKEVGGQVDAERFFDIVTNPSQVTQ